jgi:hypothetical protein
VKKIVLSVFIFSLALTGCKNGITTKQEISKNSFAENPNNGPNGTSKELKTQSGKSILITETHPHGLSLSKVQIITNGFKENRAIEISEIEPVNKVELYDLDNNGFEELYIFTQSAGSGSGGNFYVYASDKDERLIKIGNQKEIDKEYLEGGNFEGYMGHDTYRLYKGVLIREFPVYNETDINLKPTGGTKKLFYHLRNNKFEITNAEKE